jgi:putative N-acetylmannosamine-6-phosphate epimerase
MNRSDLRALLKSCPIVASVQASPNSPLEDPQILLASAQASVQVGVQILRLQGVENIRIIKQAVSTPVIGLLKVSYPGSEIYITPTKKEVLQLIELGCEIIALDATQRVRPNNENLKDLLNLIHANDRLAMADCDTFANISNAIDFGFDIISTTLSGYTPDSIATSGPNLDLLRAIPDSESIILAEGRFAEPWEVSAALRIGADGVVIGGAINDPIKQTRRFVQATAARIQENVVGVDLGGTWLRAGLFTPQAQLITSDRIPAPKTHAERKEFIRSFATLHEANQIGISAGGTIDPDTSTVIETKGFIPDYLNQSFFNFDNMYLSVRAINDGLATAWGHACHPNFAGTRVATLALGTGIGAGIVDRNRILTDKHGNYPRINDAFLPFGQTIEQTLGGMNLSGPPREPSEKQKLLIAAQIALNLINDQFPDHIVICGGVGLSEWFESFIPSFKSYAPISISPYGPDAGITGAAHLVLNPPDNFRTNL